jgi:predicted transcriptional regulator
MMDLPAKPEPIFRSRTSTRFLLAVAIGGPVLIKNLPAILGIDKHHVFDLAARFQRYGIVVVNPVRSRPYTVELDRRYFLYPELRELLFRLATQKVPRPRQAIIRGDMGIEASAMLFGTRGRTLTIAWVARLGEVNVTDLRKLIQLRDQSIRVAVRYWESVGFIRSRRLGGERVLSLNPAHPAAAQMHTLLQRLGEHLPDARGLMAWQRRTLEKRKRIVPDDEPHTAAEALPIGTPTRRELLVLLAAHGALPVSAIAKRLGWTQNSVRSVVHSLVENGLLQTARVAGLRNGSLWVSIGNPSFERFLTKAVAEFTAPRAESSPLPLVTVGVRRPRCRPKLLGPRLTRSILIALAAGIDAEEIEIAKLVGSSPRLIRRTLTRLAACGLVEWRPVGGRAKARLNREYDAFYEFEEYMSAVGVQVAKAH